MKCIYRVLQKVSLNTSCTGCAGVRGGPWRVLTSSTPPFTSCAQKCTDAVYPSGDG